MYDSYDAYGVSVPTFNIDGKSKKGTCLGCFLTILTAIILTLSVAVRLAVDQTTTSTHLQWQRSESDSQFKVKMAFGA